jgi:redox-sensitive bicupin YhaK (pirin superfamily)
MIALRRNGERHQLRHRGGEGWFSFGRPAGGVRDTFGALVRLEEYRLPPGASFPDTEPVDAEILTYVREGALVRAPVSGAATFVHPGEFHRAPSTDAVPTKVSRTQSAHLFRAWLSAADATETEARVDRPEEQRRFSAAERHGLLCVVASPDARNGSLLLRADALVLSAILEPGQHVVHELVGGRNAWLHIVCGQVALGSIELNEGDGVGLSAERSISFTARDPTEILLLDVGARAAPSSSSSGGVS